MSDFEFFFSFYGLLLGLSVTEIAAGVARVVHQRAEVKVGLLTPLLAVFVSLDVAGFWVVAWQDWRHIDFDFGILALGLVMAMTYYVSAAVVFPRDLSSWQSLDDHFWSQRRVVFGGVLFVNLLAMCGTTWAWEASGRSYPFPMNWASWGYFVLLVFAQFVRGRRAMAAILILLIVYFVNWLPQINPLQRALEKVLG